MSKDNSRRNREALQLRKETLRRLIGAELRLVVAAGWESDCCTSDDCTATHGAQPDPPL